MSDKENKYLTLPSYIFELASLNYHDIKPSEPSSFATSLCNPVSRPIYKCFI